MGGSGKAEGLAEGSCVHGHTIGKLHASRIVNEKS
jgi:hypothetical protein